MGIFRSAPTATLTADTPSAGDRPELWVPSSLRPEFDAAAATHRENITAFAHPNWLAALRGNDEHALNGEPLGLLQDHLTVALAHLHFSGIVPGHVEKSDVVARFGSKPITKTDDWESIITRSVQLEPTDADRQAASIWRYSEDHREEFSSLVARTKAEILGDAVRSWEAYVHITLIHLALANVHARREEEKRAAERWRLLGCPVCGEEPGNVDTRQLLTGDRRAGWFGDRPSIRSCVPCWHDAVAITLERLSTLADGRDRRAVVAQHLAQVSQ